MIITYNFACSDDCLDRMVPSDLRALVNERDAALAEAAAHKAEAEKMRGLSRSLPNAVKQTRPTNCFQACVACVLNVPIMEVPDACDGATWDWDAFQDWLALRGLQALEIGFENGGTIYPVRAPVLCIVTGNSPRECTTGRHAVVGELLGLEGFRLLHDPHPSDLWINGEPTHAVFFVPLAATPTAKETQSES